MIKHSHLLLAVCFLATIVARSQPAGNSLNSSTDTIFVRQNLNSVIINADYLDADSLLVKSDHYSENIDDLLDDQNGFSLTRRGNFAAEVVHRGMSSDRVNVTIDGMKLFSACTDKMDPVTSYVAMNNLKSLDKESAGMSKTFGSNIGGQVNLNTKEAILNEDKRVNTTISFGGNSASSGMQGAFNTNISEEKFAIRINGMASKHHNYRAGGGEIVEYSQYSKTNIGLNVKTKLADKTFLLADFIQDDAFDVGYPALPMDVSKASASIYSMTYRKYFSSKFLKKLDVKMYGNNITHVMDDSDREVVMHMDMPGKSDTYGAYSKLDLNLHALHKMTFIIDGYQNNSFAEMTMYPQNEAEMYMLTWPGVERSILGGFISDEYTLNEKSKLLVTFRTDAGYSEVKEDFGKKQLEVFSYNIDEPIFQRAFNASGKIDRKLGKNNLISLEFAYAERLPTVSEQFGFYIFNSQDNYDYIGDPYIKNEEAYQAEVSFDLNRKSWSFSVTTFAYHIPNYIFGKINETYSAMTIGASGVKEYINLPYAQISGAESWFSWKINRNFGFTASLTYNYGIDNNNQYLPLMSPFKSTSEVVYSFKRNTIKLNIKAVSEQNKFSELAGENKTPGYAIFGLSYQRSMMVFKQPLHLFAGIENIFDHYYWDHQDWTDLPRQGRNAFAKIQWQF